MHTLGSTKHKHSVMSRTYHWKLGLTETKTDVNFRQKNIFN